MNNVSDEEADELLIEFVNLRDKCIKSNSKLLQLNYNKCKNICAQKFDYIVKNKVKRYRSFSNYEDLLQDGRMALMLALDSYKLNHGSWFWWANQYVKTKVSREANKHSTIKIPIKQIRNFLPYKMSEMPEITDLAISAVDNIETSESVDFIHAAISRLPLIQRRVIEMYFEFNIQDKEKSSITKICSDLDITRKECVKILSDAKKSLKTHLHNISSY